MHHNMNVVSMRAPAPFHLIADFTRLGVNASRSRLATCAGTRANRQPRLAVLTTALAELEKASD